MAYGTITRASDVLDVLRSEIGALAATQRSEDDYLRRVRTHLKGILRSTTAYLDEWNYLDDVQPRAFRAGIKEILVHIEKTLATPVSQRGDPAS